jgi:hypothetical protein
MESGLHGPDGNAEAVRHLGERKVQVIDHDHESSLDGVELADTALDLITVRCTDGRVREALSGWLDRLDVDLVPQSTLVSTDLAVTRVHEQASHPGVEAVRITQSGQVTPCHDESLLRGVLGAFGIPDDEMGDAVELVDPEACKL